LGCSYSADPLEPSSPRRSRDSTPCRHSGRAAVARRAARRLHRRGSGAGRRGRRRRARDRAGPRGDRQPREAPLAQTACLALSCESSTRWRLEVNPAFRLIRFRVGRTTPTARTNRRMDRALTPPRDLRDRFGVWAIGRTPTRNPTQAWFGWVRSVELNQWVSSDSPRTAPHCPADRIGIRPVRGLAGPCEVSARRNSDAIAILRLSLGLLLADCCSTLPTSGGAEDQLSAKLGQHFALGAPGHRTVESVRDVGSAVALRRMCRGRTRSLASTPGT
jgi:hypothetical protein